MKLSPHRLLLLKQDVLALCYLIPIHIWWSFNFPGMQAYGLLICTLLSIANVMGTLFVFMFPERFSWLLNLDAFDDAPNPEAYKQAIRYFIALGTVLMGFYCWRRDYYHMPTSYYIAWSIHLLIYLLLAYRAVKQYKYVKN